MSDFVLCYYIHGDDNKIVDSGFKKGNSVEFLEGWAKEKNLDDYMIYLAMWEVKRNYIKPLEEIKKKVKNIIEEANGIEYWAKQENCQ